MSGEPLITYALRDGKLVHVDEVLNGYSCNCFCPGCKAPLNARQGAVKAHHFAHQPGSSCEYGYESSIQHLAWRILTCIRTITIPEVTMPTATGTEILFPSQAINIAEARLENYFSENQIIPDIVIDAAMPNGQRGTFIIEVLTVHKISNSKLNKINEKAISTIEINLRDEAHDDFITEEKLTKIILTEDHRKSWIYNKAQEMRIAEFHKCCNILQSVRPNNLSEYFVYGCPRNKYVYQNIPYALLMDCKNCPDCLEIVSPENNTTIDQNEIFIKCLAHIKHGGLNTLEKKTDLNFNYRCPSCGQTMRSYYSKRQNKVFLICDFCNVRIRKNSDAYRYKTEKIEPRKSIKEILGNN